MSCRICNAVTTRSVLDLGESPPANSLLDSPEEQLQSFPLVLEKCDACGNLQLRDCLDAAELYRHYFYVTPDSAMLREHYEFLHGELSKGGYLRRDSFVLEVGSNAGMLLRFLQPRTGKVLGIDPARNICEIARKNGIDTIAEFFNDASARDIEATHGKPNLIIGRHCLAHNADPHVMIRAAASLLGDDGHLVIENAYGLNTVQNNEFDQIYHEHMFYFTIRSMQALLAASGMHLVHILMAPVHGGAIVFVAKNIRAGDHVNESVDRYAAIEDKLLTNEALDEFARNARQIRSQLLDLVTELTHEDRTVCTYGATAKGNTLLNYAGLTNDDIRFCVDSTPLKQGKFLPKSGIEVVSEERALENPPDFFLLTAWNYRDEIIAKVRRSGNHHSRFIMPVPEVHILG